MANKTIAMKRLRSVLRLNAEHYSKQAIASSLRLSRNTVRKYIAALRKLELTWEDIQAMDDTMLALGFLWSRPAVWRRGRAFEAAAGLLPLHEQGDEEDRGDTPDPVGGSVNVALFPLLPESHWRQIGNGAMEPNVVVSLIEPFQEDLEVMEGPKGLEIKCFAEDTVEALYVAVFLRGVGMDKHVANKVLLEE